MWLLRTQSQKLAMNRCSGPCCHAIPLLPELRRWRIQSDQLARTHRASEMMLAVNVLGCAKLGTAKLTVKLPVILLAVSVELQEVTLVRTEMPALLRLFIAAVPVS